MTPEKEREQRYIALGMASELAKEVAKERIDPTPRDVSFDTRVLFRLIGANLTTTAAQKFERVGDFTNGVILHAVACNAPITPTAAVGAVWGNSDKTSGITSTTPTFAAMSTPSRYISPALAATNVFQDEAYLILDTASSASGATCDYYLIGFTIG